jgi:hypothetical protein
MNKYPEIPIRTARVLAERLSVADQKVAASCLPPMAPAAPVQIVAPGKNDAGPVAAPPESTKAKIHRKLLETFQSLYTLKALSRFSVAVLGCPVEGLAANILQEIRVGDVKALFFPAGTRVEMQIAASEPGAFTLVVFTPANNTAYHFGPVLVNPRDSVWMSICFDKVKLQHGLREIPFSL